MILVDHNNFHSIDEQICSVFSNETYRRERETMSNGRDYCTSSESTWTLDFNGTNLPGLGMI